MNKYIATGRLTRNPEVKQSQGGKSYSQFSIAVDRSFVGPSGQKQVDFINCVAWGKTAENLAKYQTKGSKILIEGELQQNNYKSKTGENKMSYTVSVNCIEFLGKKTDASDNKEYDPFADIINGQEDNNQEELKDVANDNLPF